MLDSKQRSYLRGLGNTAETILIIGKSGISDNTVQEAQNALTARELIKCRALETCELSPREAAEELAAKAGADVVQVIGTKFVLYKPNPKLESDKRITLPKARAK